MASAIMAALRLWQWLMSKRRLSDQQTRRIRDRQQQRATGKNVVASGADDTTLGAEQAGLVIAHFGRSVEVEMLEGDLCGQSVRCHLRANLISLVTGDRVVLRVDAASTDERRTGVIVASQPRRTLLARPDSHSGIPKPVAANIDRLGIVIAPEPQPFANLIDRYLVAAENAGITPFLVLNKRDLLNDNNREFIEALLQEYRAIGYHVISASTRDDQGLDALKEQIRDHICAFVGQSGVGKSSLISTLLPGVEIRIGDLSQAENKGRHTTTTARLFHLDICDLIDSPGIREFGLDHLDRIQVENGFIELKSWLGRCRFRDCRHLHEPGCILLEAEAQGAISPARLQSFRAILSEASA